MSADQYHTIYIKDKELSDKLRKIVKDESKNKSKFVTKLIKRELDSIDE